MGHSLGTLLEGDIRSFSMSTMSFSSVRGIINSKEKDLEEFEERTKGNWLEMEEKRRKEEEESKMAKRILVRLQREGEEKQRAMK